MKAIYQYVVYTVSQCYGYDIELTRDDGTTFRVPYSAETLTIDPTDGDLEEADFVRETARERQE